ncbi:MAG: D-Ala-D-Ala carboxypeptidase family metallohydrolase [Salaquimonas sp.]
MKYFSDIKLALILVCVLSLTGCIQSNDTKTSVLESAASGHKVQQAAFLEKQQSVIEQQKKLIEEQRQKNLALLNKSSALNPKPGSLAVPPKSKTLKTEAPVKKASVTANSRGANVTFNAPWKCVPDGLKAVVYEVARRYGPVTVNSTHRSRSKNRRIGGARQSYHLKCAAVDFRVKGNTSSVLKYLRRHPNVGGVKRYRSGYFHIDNGPKRTWR